MMELEASRREEQSPSTYEVWKREHDERRDQLREAQLEAIRRKQLKIESMQEQMQREQREEWCKIATKIGAFFMVFGCVASVGGQLGGIYAVGLPFLYLFCGGCICLFSLPDSAEGDSAEERKQRKKRRREQRRFDDGVLGLIIIRDGAY